MEEADLRTDNMGVDSQARFVKIDNDGAIATLVFALTGSIADKFSFKPEDVDRPHDPIYFDPTTWQTQVFKGKNLMTEENIKELYSFWQKMLQNKQAILQLAESTIEDVPTKMALTEKLNHKFKALENILETHPGYNQFIANEAQSEETFPSVTIKESLVTLKEKEQIPEVQNTLNNF